MKKTLILLIAVIVSGGCTRTYQDTQCPCVVRGVEYGSITQTYYVVAEGNGGEWLKYSTKEKKI